jgi:hypothetical protein
MDIARLRAWWSYRQGLDGRLVGKSAARTLEEVGWMRSVGGSGPYLGLFARCGAGREAVDKGVEKLELHELPSARGCTYVLPKRDFALGLRVGQLFAGGDMNVARKLGVTDAEIAKLGKAVVATLKNGSLYNTMDPDEIRAATGSASRGLGEAGKKKGMTTTLPLALGQLQSQGEIRRVPVNGRLDQQRYKYTAWSPNPLAGYKLDADEATTALARMYFTWTGPASIAEYQWFSALSGKAAKAALEPLRLQPFEVHRLILPEYLDEWKSFKTPKDAHYVLVSSIDSLILLRRDLPSLLDPADAKHKLLNDGGRGLKDLSDHAIINRGQIVGLWQFDPEKQEIVWVSFIKKNADLTAAVAKTAEYIRKDLGDARSFSLDSPKSRAPRIAALQGLDHVT